MSEEGKYQGAWDREMDQMTVRGPARNTSEWSRSVNFFLFVCLYLAVLGLSFGKQDL